MLVATLEPQSSLEGSGDIASSVKQDRAGGTMTADLGGPRGPREKREAPGGSLTCLVTSGARPSARLLVVPWPPFQRRWATSERRLHVMTILGYLLFSDRTVSGDTSSRATVVPSALSRPALPTLPTTHALSLPREGSRTCAVHFDSESSLQEAPPNPTSFYKM